MTTITISGVVWTVYESSTNCEAFENSRAGSTWPQTGTNPAKDTALVTATRWMNEQKWQGTVTTPGQALAWPRTGVVDINGAAVAGNVTPNEILWGYYELATALLADPTILDNALGQASNVKAVRAGSAEVRFFRPVGGSRLPTSVFEMIRVFLASQVGVAVGLSSGTIDPDTGEPYPSSFDGSQPTDDFGINR
jgi:hypothetical protein